MKKIKKIPYGESNFETVIDGDYYFVDKSEYIKRIEDSAGKYLFFLRPRRFGKSLFLSMLEHYYDINRKDQFDELFNDLWIHKNPTSLRNSLPILKFNFSGVKTTGAIEEIERSFNLSIRLDIEEFFAKYANQYKITKKIIDTVLLQKDAGDLLSVFMSYLKRFSVRYYLLIDEYDNLANNILIEHGENKYKSSTQAGGFLRNFFAVIKNGTDDRTIERLFITGVSPLVLSDVTSGFNIGDNISIDMPFSSMVGFTQKEIEEIIDYYIEQKKIEKTKRTEILKDMKDWYNSYLFCVGTEKLYNSDMVLYYIHSYLKNREKPINMLDENVRTDYKKLKFLITKARKLNGNFRALRNLLEERDEEYEFVKSFSIKEIEDDNNFVSFLYYLGLITFNKKRGLFYNFIVPNRVIKKMLWGFIEKSLKEAGGLEFDSSAYGKMFNRLGYDGELFPLLNYVFDRFYNAVSNRDFIYKEAGVKGFLLAFLNMSYLYKVSSEREENKGYIDIILEPSLSLFDDMRPDNYIIELKYITKEELDNKKTNMIEKYKNDAIKQLARYEKNLIGKVHKIVIIAGSNKLYLIEEI